MICGLSWYRKNLHALPRALVFGGFPALELLRQKKAKKGLWKPGKWGILNSRRGLLGETLLKKR